MSLERDYQPQLIEEAEALLGTPFFYDEASYDVDDYSAEQLGLKRFVYQSCCRVLARARAEDRASTSLLIRSGEVCDSVRDWNEGWTPTARKMAEIAFRYEDNVSMLSRQLALVNNATEYVNDHWDELKERLHEGQQVYMLDIMTSLQKPPRTVRYVDRFGESEPYVIQGTTIIAPTGFGKTRLIETCAKMFEPGKPLRNSTRVNDPTRIVVVSPSIILLDQTASQLAEQLPDVRVGKMHGGKKEPDADIVLSTIDAFNSDFDDGKIAGHPVGVVMVDEAHHLAEPQFRKTFVTQWRGTSLVFTATPAYDLERDVRAIIPHEVEKTNILKSIEKGVLNDGQILTFFIDDNMYGTLLERYDVDPTDAQKHAVIREVIDTLVLEFVTPLLEEGRRGIIFCEQGEKAHWARRMAERLEGLTLSDGRTVKAAAMYSYANNLQQVVEGFRKGSYDVITTVDMGREGFDANLDFVIVNCNIVSRLRGHQIVGRGTRVSERFPTTVYGQFSYRIEGTQWDKLYSIEEAFGGDTVMPLLTLRDRHSMQRTPGASRQTGPIDMRPFPDIIKDLLGRIDRKPVGEAFISMNRGRRKVTEGLIPLPDILLGFEATEMRAKKLLRAAGHQWYGQLEGEQGSRRLVHYYSTEARDYLHEILPKGTYLTPEEMANILGVPLVAVKQIIAAPENNITGRRVPRGNTGQPPWCYDEEEQAVIARIAKTIPGVNRGDRRLTEVAQEFGVDSGTVWKWAGATDEGRINLGGVRYLTASEVAVAIFERDKVPLATDQEMSLIRIAERAGVDYQVVNRNMTTEDWAAAREKRYKDRRGYTRMTHIWPAEKAEEIAARMEKFKARPLEAHLLPSNALRKIIRKFGVIPSTEIAGMLAEGGHEIQEVIVVGTRSMSRCLTWQAIAHLEGILGKNKSKTSVVLDYSRLPSGPDDADPAKIAYAQSVQARFLRYDQLKNYGSIEP